MPLFNKILNKKVMFLFSSIIIYIVSIILMRWLFLLHSSKYLDLWLDEDCRFHILWVIPVVNSLVAIMMTIMVIYIYIREWSYKGIKIKNKMLRKLLNLDL